jgi:hypothetical protein
METSYYWRPRVTLSPSLLRRHLHGTWRPHRDPTQHGKIPQGFLLNLPDRYSACSTHLGSPGPYLESVDLHTGLRLSIFQSHHLNAPHVTSLSIVTISESSQISRKCICSNHIVRIIAISLLLWNGIIQSSETLLGTPAIDAHPY